MSDLATSSRRQGGASGRIHAGALHAACLGLLLGLLPARPAAGQDGVPEGGVVASYQRLVGAGQALSDRTVAAENLLRIGNDEAEQALQSALAVGQEPEAWHAVLLAIASSLSDPPDELGLPVFSLMMRVDAEEVDEWAAAMARFDDKRWRQELEDIAERAGRPVEERARAIEGLGHFREKDVAQTLVELTEVDKPEAVRAAAFDALTTLTGIRVFDQDTEAWQAWYQQVKGFKDARWFGHLVDNFARREADANARHQQLEDRLLQSQRALYRTTDATDKSAVLAYMLGDPLLPIRQLGIEFARQRLVDGQAFDEPLRGALRARLDDASPEIRQAAAQLLHDLADAPAADAVAARLAQQAEPVPAVQRAMLRLLTRLPRAEAVEPALEMLNEDKLRGEAAGALAAAADSDLLSRRDRDKARKELRRYLRDGVVPPPQVVTLLAKIGDDDDWNRIAGWVENPDTSVKQAAALAWAESDRSLKLLAERMRDPIIEPIVISAAIGRGDDPWTLQALSRGKPDSEQAVTQWERALIAMSGRVPPDAVLKTESNLADNGETPALRERLLTAAIDAADGRDAEQTPASYPSLLLRRGEARMMLGSPALAAVDFERLGEFLNSLSVVQRERRERGLVEAYLLTAEDAKAFAALQTLLGDGAGSLRLAATDDPLIERFLDAAIRHADAGRTTQATALLDRLREVMGTRIKPEVAQRISSVQADIDRRRSAAARGEGGDEDTP